MEKEQYSHEETQSTPTSQEERSIIETGGQKNSVLREICIAFLKALIQELEKVLVQLEEESDKEHTGGKSPQFGLEHGWLHSILGIPSSDSLAGESTKSLEKRLSKLQKEYQESRKISSDIFQTLFLRKAINDITLELLMRKNPEVRTLHEAWETIQGRKNSLQYSWEKEILATEGEEGLKRRKQDGEGPGREYTYEELDIYVRYTKAKVDGGVKPPSDLTHALNVQTAGGFYQWEKESKRKNYESFIQELASRNSTELTTVIQNIFLSNERSYGQEYAEQQHAILAGLAGIAAQEATSTSLDNTNG